MEGELSIEWMTAGQNQRITEAVEREGGRLRGFIRRRVADAEDAEDILQEVFYELVEAHRLAESVEQVGAWLFRVARNRITDLFRKRRTRSLTAGWLAVDEDGDPSSLEDLLPAPDAGPEAAYARGMLLDELEQAIGELPDAQRAVFVAHELEGRRFSELAAETGVSVNTLLSRKHYAVERLRRRLRSVYEEFVDA